MILLRLTPIQKKKLTCFATGILLVSLFIWWWNLPLPVYVPDDPADVFISSAYYYPKSKSLGDNSLAFIFNADVNKFAKFEYMNIRTSNPNRRLQDTMRIQRTSDHIYCDWNTFFGTAKATPEVTKVEIEIKHNQFYEIPVTQVSYEKKDVVVCIAPLFANEQWQNLIYATHIAKRYGAFINLYIRSSVTPVFDLAKIYEKEGYLKIQPWTRIVLDSIPDYVFNPNMNIIFRNQEAAQSDCLLQYKESAEFIALVDLDDVLVPRVRPTYIEEFRELLTPDYDYLMYTRESAAIETDMDSGVFTLKKMLRTTFMIDQYILGKMVFRPENFNHTQIHFPGGNEYDRKELELHKRINSMWHLKIKMTKNTTWPMNNPYKYIFRNDNSSLFKNEDLLAMESDFDEIKSKYPDVWSPLPKKFYYLSIISKCYFRRFYDLILRFSKFPCPGPDMCRLPEKVDIPCVNAVGEFHSSEEGDQYVIHYGTRKNFVEEKGCIP